MNKNEQMYIQFNFNRNGSLKGPLLFSNPVEVITTRDSHEVRHCLEQIDQAVAAGFYAAGYVSYEALGEDNHTSSHNTMPLLTFGIFHKPEEVQRVVQQADFHVGNWRMIESKETYKQNFDKIIAAIQNGDIEEINYTVPFEAAFEGDSLAYYEQLRKAQQADYCAYLSMDGFDILSASPELFYQVENNEVTVRPMKGTTHRGHTYEADMQQKEWLRTSEKNKMENRIIKDLMEKELQKVTVPGSIRTKDPFRIEKYPTVYQMTSGLTGEVLSDKSIMKVLEALFPCGSIAGVPKTDGLQLIRELESRPREVYCGAIGYMTPAKEAIFNVPIRTVWIDQEKKTAHYGAGGAITIHSNMEEEFHEVYTKTNVLTWKQPAFELLETIGLYDGIYIVWNQHFKRLEESADYFDIPVDIKSIKQKLEQVKINHPTGNWRVRLTISQDGTSNITTAPLQKTTTVQPICFAHTAVNVDNRFLYHKTTNRLAYDVHQQVEVFDVLLFNEQGEVTEFTIGNLVVKIGSALFTPPVASGLLPGTFRAQLLEEGTIQEKTLFKKDVQHADNMWLINSVRQWVEVTLD